MYRNRPKLEKVAATNIAIMPSLCCPTLVRRVSITGMRCLQRGSSDNPIRHNGRQSPGRSPLPILVPDSPTPNTPCQAHRTIAASPGTSWLPLIGVVTQEQDEVCLVVPFASSRHWRIVVYAKIGLDLDGLNHCIIENPRYCSREPPIIVVRTHTPIMRHQTDAGRQSLVDQRSPGAIRLLLVPLISGHDQAAKSSLAVHNRDRPGTSKRLFP
jgi:hypothetical protein